MIRIVRIVVTSQPAYGHLHPMVPLCRALSSAGHEVMIASSRPFLPQLEATGLEAVTAGVDWLESEIADAFPEYAEHRARGEAKWYLQSEIFGWYTARAMADDVVSLASTGPVDLIIREPWEFGGAIAATRLRIPCVLHGIGGSGNVEEVVDLAGDRLRQHAADLGVDDLWDWLGGDLYLDPCPPCLQPVPRTFHPKHRQLIRPVPFDATDGSPDAPRWMAELGARPVVYVGLGTVMNRWHGLLERVVRDVRDVDADIVVTTGPGLDPSSLGEQRENVRVEQYVPLTMLFPQCDLVVCHAGWGTTIAALAHGLPVVAIPLGADGPRTAQRCEAAGLGRSVDHETAGTGTVATAVEQLLQSEDAKSSAAAARQQIGAMAHPKDVVQIIEDL